MSKYYNGQNEPIIADFSMSGMEAEFAKGEKKMSKDKMAALGAAGVAGVGTVGAAARYGGAELGARKAAKQYSTPAVANAIRKTGGAKGRLSKDVSRVKSAAGRVGGAVKKGIQTAGYKASNANIGRILKNIGKAAKRAK